LRKNCLFTSLSFLSLSLSYTHTHTHTHTHVSSVNFSLEFRLKRSLVECNPICVSQFSLFLFLFLFLILSLSLSLSHYFSFTLFLFNPFLVSPFPLSLFCLSLICFHLFIFYHPPISIYPLILSICLFYLVCLFATLYEDHSSLFVSLSRFFLLLTKLIFTSLSL
jgi:hypothetical protein